MKAFGYLVDAGAKKYDKEFGSNGGQAWHQMFPASTRKIVAKELTQDFEGEYALGNYDHLLPKKYQPKATAHARKAKSMGDYEAEGYKAHTWYLADCPYTQSKIRDAWQRGAWKWQQEQRAQRPSKSSGHATRAKSELHTKLHEPGALRSATDRQLRGFYRDEQRDVASARAEAARRGVTLHARKRCAQLDREIANVVPSWQGGR